MARKREVIWGIRLYGSVIPHLLAGSRRAAITKLRETYRTSPFDISVLPSWPALRKQGYSVHKLEVRDA